MDYSALAQKYGGTTTPASSGIDYSTLASKYGGTTTPTKTEITPPSIQPKTTLAGTLLSPTIEGMQGLKTLFGGGSQGIASKLANDVSTGASDYAQPLGMKNLLSLVKVGFRTAGDVAGAVYAPVAATVGATGVGNLFNKVGELSQNKGGILDKLTDLPAIQQFVQKHPNAAEDFGRALNIAFASADVGKIEPKTALSRTNAAVTDYFTPTTEEVFTKNLDTAKEVIYPKFTAKEKATLPLKDVNGKSVVDLESAPYIKPVIEAVARLPEDIQLAKGDSPVQTESKLNQGISRLHQGTDAYLYDQKANTTFKPKAFMDSFQKNVLEPTAKEFGFKSPEVDALSETMNVVQDLIEDPDAHGVYKARQELQTVMKDRFPNAFKKSTLGLLLDSKAAAKVDAFKAMRNFMNDFVSENLLEENDPYRARLKEESNLITAKEQFRVRNTDQIGQNSLYRFLNRNPKAKTVFDIGKGFLKLGTVGDIVKHL